MGSFSWDLSRTDGEVSMQLEKAFWSRFFLSECSYHLPEGNTLCFISGKNFNQLKRTRGKIPA